jgi:putative ABC transport system permease protein
VGILNPAILASEIDSEVLVGFPAAEKYLSFDRHPSQVYIRTVDTQAATTEVDNLLGAQASPSNPTGHHLPANSQPESPRGAHRYQVAGRAPAPLNREVRSVGGRARRGWPCSW